MLRSVVLFAVVSAAFLGCSSGPSAQRGGVATIGAAIMAPFKTVGEKVSSVAGTKPSKPAEVKNGEVASITQPENPSQKSTQTVEFDKTETLTYAADTSVKIESTLPDGTTTVVTEAIPAGSKKTTTIRQKVGQELGASQKDTARETTAILGSLKWVQYIGVLAFLVGAGGFFHPILRTALAGRENAMVLAGCGLVLIFGPVVFVQYANWFALALIGWGLFWAYSRYSYNKGQLDTIKGSGGDS